MTSSHTPTLRRLAASAVVGTAATVALAAPAQAMFVHDPVTGSAGGSAPTSTTQTSDNGWQLLQVGVGAAGGIVVAGAAAGAAAGLHRRRVAHPA